MNKMKEKTKEKNDLKSKGYDMYMVMQKICNKKNEISHHSKPEQMHMTLYIVKHIKTTCSLTYLFYVKPREK